MRCPYCNKFLKQVHTTAYCYWCGCDKADGMFGTLAMWEKVASLVKIRNAGKKYRLKPDVKEKVAEHNKKYRETHKEYYRNYYQKLKQGGKDA